MREVIARVICLLSLLVVAALALAFAVRFNPDQRTASATIPTAPDARTAPTPDAALIGQRSGELGVVPDSAPPPEGSPAGLAVYGRTGCVTCHSVRGRGNPRYPLDGCASRWTADELRAWVTGTGTAADVLSDGIRRRKSRYQNLPAEDLDALVAYLGTLR